MFSFSSRIIFPQNKNGSPMINPCGKYLVKLQINGVSRKVSLLFSLYNIYLFVYNSALHRWESFSVSWGNAS